MILLLKKFPITNEKPAVIIIAENNTSWLMFDINIAPTPYELEKLKESFMSWMLVKDSNKSPIIRLINPK